MAPLFAALTSYSGLQFLSNFALLVRAKRLNHFQNHEILALGESVFDSEGLLAIAAPAACISHLRQSGTAAPSLRLPKQRKEVFALKLTPGTIAYSGKSKPPVDHRDKRRMQIATKQGRNTENFSTNVHRNETQSEPCASGAEEITKEED
jgi:hypothetical protein